MGYPQLSSIYRWNCWNSHYKPSSYWDTPSLGNPHLLWYTLIFVGRRWTDTCFESQLQIKPTTTIPWRIWCRGQFHHCLILLWKTFRNQNELTSGSSCPPASCCLQAAKMRRTRQTGPWHWFRPCDESRTLQGRTSRSGRLERRRGPNSQARQRGVLAEVVAITKGFRSCLQRVVLLHIHIYYR